MDILAHTLWAGAGAALMRRRVQVTPRTAALTMGMAAAPDILPALPVLAWWGFGGGTFAVVSAFAIALPGKEPSMPSVLSLVSHHLHCLAHSAVVAGIVTLLLWRLRRALWVPLLGWWSHIVIDVFTHSDSYYPSPVLYPFTQRGFDGIAWISPWFMVLNYLALAAIGMWLLSTARRRPERAAAPSRSRPGGPT
jgi:hypothetical protein